MIKSTSQGTLEARRRAHCRTPRRSDSFTICRPQIGKENLSVSPVPAPIDKSEWGVLARQLRIAFLRSSEITPEHPAGESLAAINLPSLRDELFSRGRWQAGVYTRTTLLEGSGFNVMLLCWAPGCTSPVHAHSCAESLKKSNCFLLVLEGSLTETVYDKVPNALLVLRP